MKERTTDQGKYGENTNSYTGDGTGKETWVCPNDDTINTGDACVVCGCPHPARGKLNKKNIVICVAALVVLFLGFLLGRATPIEPAVETLPPKAPSEDDVIAFGEVIAYPEDDAYLPAYETMYVKSTKGNSIYVYWNSNGADEYRRRFLAYEADEVTVLARQHGFSCIIFEDRNGNEQIGWVNSDLLVYQY